MLVFLLSEKNYETVTNTLLFAELSIPPAMIQQHSVAVTKKHALALTLKRRFALLRNVF